MVVKGQQKAKRTIFDPLELETRRRPLRHSHRCSNGVPESSKQPTSNLSDDIPNPTPATSTTTSSTPGRAFIKKIIPYQQSNGAFLFLTDTELKTVLGPVFYTTLKSSMPGNIPQLIAVAALLVVLLETQFEACRGLWVLVAEKAKGFVRLNVEDVDPEKVFTDVFWAVTGMELLDLEEDGTVSM